MKPILLMAILVASLLSCATISPVRNLPLMNREFPAGNGTFIFRDVVLNGTTLPGSWNIKGFVRNTTEEDWRRVQFDVELFDETGNTLKNYIDSKVTFIAYSLMKRDEHSFTTNYFKFLPKQNPMQGISRYTITYKDIYEGGEKKDSEKLRFIMVKPWQSPARVFEDQSIKIVFSISETQIGIVLHNKLNVPIKVDWNNVSYVDIAGLAHAVVHTGIRYIERDRSQVATLIPPGAMIEDAIIPSDHISFSSGSGGAWSSRELFPISQKTDLYIGKSFSVFMPLEINGAIKNYLFAFSIEREAT